MSPRRFADELAADPDAPMPAGAVDMLPALCFTADRGWHLQGSPELEAAVEDTISRVLRGRGLQRAYDPHLSWLATYRGAVADGYTEAHARKVADRLLAPQRGRHAPRAPEPEQAVDPAEFGRLFAVQPLDEAV